MHQFLRSIGFSRPLTRKQIHDLIQEGVEKTVYRAYTNSSTKDDCLFAQYDIPMGNGFGLSVFGEFDEEDVFYPEYYFPYLDSNRVSSTEDVTIERRVDNNSYVGVCDDLRLGLTLVFRLRNTVEYLRQTRTGETRQQTPENTSVSLSALSQEGKILLPIYKSDSDRRQIRNNAARKRQLNSAARDGDEEAMLNLTAEEMDTYVNIVQQIQYDDVYTIVDSYFMPYGTECELYSVLGEIVDFTIRKNEKTQEEIVVLTLDCNGLQFNVAINRKDLYGEPAAGRRFKGVIWLMGKVNFS